MNDSMLRQLPYLYGTAWKKDATTGLVMAALRAGFRGIDTACQPKHYQEDLVGAGLRQAIAEGIVRRDELFVQTKFTSVDGQDPNNMPYDETRPLVEQVNTSIQTSLWNLRSDGNSESYIDSLVLHSPLSTLEQTIEAWNAVSKFRPRIRSQGISNVDPRTLEALYEAVEVKPSVVQNRFYPRTGFDVQIRKFCRERGIIYQTFWTLTGNPELVISAPVVKLAEAMEISRQVALYLLVLELDGTVVLNGTTNKERMKGDINTAEAFKTWKSSNVKIVSECVKSFKELIGDLA
jgi:diketogulonate reductase-like aldo/keto reductase